MLHWCLSILNSPCISGIELFFVWFDTFVVLISYHDGVYIKSEIWSCVDPENFSARIEEMGGFQSTFLLIVLGKYKKFEISMPRPTFFFFKDHCMLIELLSFSSRCLFITYLTAKLSVYTIYIASKTIYLYLWIYIIG